MPNKSLTLSRTPEELRSSFFALNTPDDLATLLDVDYNRLRYHVRLVPPSIKYNTFTISKQAGGTREISAPVTSLKIIQRKLNQVLQHVYKRKPSVHGFISNRSIVTNAQMHRGKRYILNIDLKDFYPTINFGRVRGMFMGTPYNLNPEVATWLAQICSNNNQLPQGAPTSPIVSNMICAQMDSQLQRLAKNNRCLYTRYADDITFSTNLAAFPSALAIINQLGQIEIGAGLSEIIDNNGFKINFKKVRLQQRKKGRLEVTGITVNEKLNVRRKYIRQLSAMLHSWEKFGLKAAHDEFIRLYDKKNRDPERKDLFFKYIVKGKLEFLGMVKGKDDAIYRKFYKKLSTLAPELVIEEVTSPITDPYSLYERGLAKLLIELDQVSSYFMDALTLESRLRENIHKSRIYGDNETNQSQRNATIAQLNSIAFKELGKTFNSLCE